ncbi:MHYT domain-containing protein (plasmid) [Streptomyces sp. AHU1]|uniref:MHYT domain-containing protein n=1 Tax=Streptomyces sp. AHU1 TaxID=3377215 RepID=UPI003878017C
MPGQIARAPGQICGWADSDTRPPGPANPSLPLQGGRVTRVPVLTRSSARSGSLAVGHQHLYTHAVFPVWAYVAVCIGFFQGRACLARFRACRTNRAWLILGSLALGSGLWGMHVIALLGFGVTGMPESHDATLTIVSALLCLGAVTLGLSLADAFHTWQGLVSAGTVLTVGLTGTQLLSMAALDAPAVFHWSLGIALISIVLTGLGAAGVVWLARTAVSSALTTAAAFLAAALLCAAQYTGLGAATVTPATELSGHGSGALSGAGLAVPVAAVLGMVILTTAFNLYVTPIQDILHNRTLPATWEAQTYPPPAAIPTPAVVRVIEHSTAIRPAPDVAIEAGPVMQTVS